MLQRKNRRHAKKIFARLGQREKRRTTRWPASAGIQVFLRIPQQFHSTPSASNSAYEKSVTPQTLYHLGANPAGLSAGFHPV